MASPMSHAWCASRTTTNAACASASARSRPTPRRKLRFEIPRRPGTSPARIENRPGIANAARTAVVQTPAGTPGRIHAATSVSNAAGAATDRREAGAHGPPGGVGDPRGEPGQELPVASGPAVLSGGGDLVMRRELLEELDVGRETRAGKEPFEEVVGKESVLGDSAGESP